MSSYSWFVFQLKDLSNIVNVIFFLTTFNMNGNILRVIFYTHNLHIALLNLEKYGSILLPFAGTS